MKHKDEKVQPAPVGQVERGVRPLVAVLAGTYEQFRHWQQQNKDSQGVYCDEWPRFAGLEFVRLVEIGTFRQRKDALDLLTRVAPMVRPNGPGELPAIGGSARPGC